MNRAEKSNCLIYGVEIINEANPSARWPNQHTCLTKLAKLCSSDAGSGCLVIWSGKQRNWEIVNEVCKALRGPFPSFTKLRRRFVIIDLFMHLRDETIFCYMVYTISQYPSHKSVAEVWLWAGFDKFHNLLCFSTPSLQFNIWMVKSAR